MMSCNEKLRYGVAAIAFSMFWFCESYLEARDWPTYRGDNHRSGVSAESLKLPLKETWVHNAGQKPRPGWPELPAKRDILHRLPTLSPTCTYDRAFHTAIAGESLYYGSSADDTVYCLEASTGKRRWSFVTGGPVRLAPTVVDGRVYVGSDDGCVYCLNAQDGTLLWKVRGGPDDRRLPGNGRMISLWPVRCGIVVDGGRAYFCAGLFPSQGVYLCAVGAKDGGEIWKKKVDVSSQGYLLASPSRLFLPTGRAPIHVFGRANGESVASLPGSGCFGVLVENVPMHSAGERGGVYLSGNGPKEKVVFSSGVRLIVKGPFSYIVSGDRLYALDRAHYLELSLLQNKKEKTVEEIRRIAELGGESKAYLKWDVACSAPYELIMAGDTVFAGGEDKVVAYNAADGTLLWTGAVAGKAYGLAVSEGRLFVSTDRGAIHCFESGTVRDGPVVVSETPGKAWPSPYPEDEWTPVYRRAAEIAVEAAGVKKGYCLVLGAGSGRLAYEIGRRSTFRVVGLEADAEKVAKARKLLGKVGLYGSRIAIHHGKLDDLPYPKYFANLVTSDEAVVTGKLPASPTEVCRVLRPCGGVAVFVQSPGVADRRAFQKWGEGGIPGWKVEKDNGNAWVGMARRGPLVGAGEWTHFHADSGNSACSNDALKFGPMDIQWFGRPGPRRMVDRHEKTVSPLYKDGRLFISGDNYIVAVDAYNSTILWERDLPDSIRLGAFKNAGSMVATEECLYVASGSQCIAFDVQTGEKKLALRVPAAPGGDHNEWGYVASVEDILFGSGTKPNATFRVQDLPTQTLIWKDYQPVVCSDVLFAYNRHTGEKLWRYGPKTGVIINPTIAVGGGRVYCVESTNPETRKVADGRIKLDMLLGQGSDLVALDMRTGKILWKKPAELEALQHVVFLSYAKETLVVTGTKNVRVGERQRVRYDLHGFDATTGKRLWKTTQTPIPDDILDGPHGEQVQHSAIVGATIYNTGFACDLKTGKKLTGWAWRKSEKCGAVSTSASCAFSRYSNPCMFDLKTGQPMTLTRVTRPGCWINIIPAGGMILIPEQSSGCTCDYAIQTSLALVPRDGGR